MHRQAAYTLSLDSKILMSSLGLKRLTLSITTGWLTSSIEKKINWIWQQLITPLIVTIKIGTLFSQDCTVADGRWLLEAPPSRPELSWIQANRRTPLPLQICQHRRARAVLDGQPTQRGLSVSNFEFVSGRLEARYREGTNIWTS